MKGSPSFRSTAGQTFWILLFLPSMEFANPGSGFNPYIALFITMPVLAKIPTAVLN